MVYHSEHPDLAPPFPDSREIKAVTDKHTEIPAAVLWPHYNDNYFWENPASFTFITAYLAEGKTTEPTGGCWQTVRGLRYIGPADLKEAVESGAYALASQEVRDQTGSDRTVDFFQRVLQQVLGETEPVVIEHILTGINFSSAEREPVHYYGIRQGAAAKP